MDNGIQWNPSVVAPASRPKTAATYWRTILYSSLRLVKSLREVTRLYRNVFKMPPDFKYIQYLHQYVQMRSSVMPLFLKRKIMPEVLQKMEITNLHLPKMNIFLAIKQNKFLDCFFTKNIVSGFTYIHFYTVLYYTYRISSNRTPGGSIISEGPTSGYYWWGGGLT